MLLAAAPWRLRLRDGDSQQVLGTGFLISPRLALTCEHVVDQTEGRAVWVDFGDSGERSARARPNHAPSHETTRSDVAVLRLNEPARAVSPAPMGPAEPPPVGTLLAAFGFPRLRRGDDLSSPGAWVQVVVDGPGMLGDRIQLTNRTPHGLQITHGFSGGPVVDPQNGVVVGMVAEAWDSQRVTSMIPVCALAKHRPDIRQILLASELTDPAFLDGIESLNSRNYAKALADFRTVCELRPENPDTWYYVALAALRGQRPRAHPTTYVEEIGRLLQQAASLRPRRAHVCALWALLKEDHHRARGLSGGSPTVEELRRTNPFVSSRHAHEICTHVPAPEAVTWQELHQRRGSP
jgi:Trypsin-like peptidase domain